MSTTQVEMTEVYEKGSLYKEEENSNKDHSKTKNRFTSDTKSFFPWFFYFSLTALVVMVVGVFFQMQLIALEKELATLKLKFSGCEEKSRNLKKRSSIEEEGAVIQAAHLQGTRGFLQVEKKGKIGPWSATSTDNTFITLRKGNTEIEISQTGVYYVYAQIYYLTSEPHNSFQILTYKGTKEKQFHRQLAICSSQGRNSMGETSCYTGFMKSFYSGERLYLNQIEQNRLIQFVNGSSYFGTILLKKNAALKPKT